MVIERTFPSVLMIGSIALYPGMNTLPDSIGAKISAYPLFAEQVKIGRLKVIEAVKTSSTPTPIPPVDENQDLASAKEILELKTVMAVQVLEKTLNITVLKKVIELEPRKGVKAAAKEQLDKMLGKK